MMDVCFSEGGIMSYNIYNIIYINFEYIAEKNEACRRGWCCCMHIHITFGSSTNKKINPNKTTESRSCHIHHIIYMWDINFNVLFKKYWWGNQSKDDFRQVELFLVLFHKLKCFFGNWHFFFEKKTIIKVQSHYSLIYNIIYHYYMGWLKFY